MSRMWRAKRRGRPDRPVGDSRPSRACGCSPMTRYSPRHRASGPNANADSPAPENAKTSGRSSSAAGTALSGTTSPPTPAGSGSRRRRRPPAQCRRTDQVRRGECGAEGGGGAGDQLHNGQRVTAEDRKSSSRPTSPTRSRSSQMEASRPSVVVTGATYRDVRPVLGAGCGRPCRAQCAGRGHQ